MGGDGSGAYRYPKVVGYTLVKQVGGGGFSSVYQAVHYEDHRVAACKVIALTANTRPAERKSIDKEMRVHANLKHRNILEFINAVVVEPGDRSGAESGKKPYFPAYYMLLEFAAAGDLFDKIAPDVGLNEETAHFYFRQILDGVSFIHGEGVCHRDLKPENLLLDAAGTLKISDFGLCSVYKLKDTGRTRMLSERCGSLPYVAPELNSNEPYVAEPVDVWGIGVILFTMLVGNTPWDEPTKRSLEFSHYVSGAYLNDEPWTRLSDQAHSLITGLLTIDPRDRFTLEYAKQHPWVLPESQLASQSPEAIAQQLTQSLRDNGDLALANPNLSPSRDEDDDAVMLSATRGSQFVNSLLLFSQTQYGTRYTKQLTRFYATIHPGELFVRIEEALTAMGVQFKRGLVDAERQTARMRVGGLDNRKVAYKGWIDVEPFTTLDCPVAQAFCLLSRDEGDPLSWRRLFKALVTMPRVMPHLLVQNK